MKGAVCMEIRFNVTGVERKALVTAVSGITGWAPVYMKAPTFAYVVQNYTIDKDGTLICEERTDAGSVRELLAELAGQGFAPEDPVDLTDPAGDAPAADFAGGDSSEDAHDTLSIEIPLPGFTGADFDKLEKLVASKADLIKKAVSVSDLSVEREGDNLYFSWFAPGSSPEEVAAYTQFVTALCEMAKKQRRVVAKEKPADNEKFAFRCFLLRLGFIGDAYASARKILLKNLPGDGSFKSGKRKERDESEAASVAANAADSGAVSGGASVTGEVETEAHGAEHAHTGGIADSCALAEALADAELIHDVNMLFEEGAVGDGGNE